MKKIDKLLTVMLWLCATFVCALTLFMSFRYKQNQSCPGDLFLRHNEVCCAHTGVNSFHVWNRERVHQLFRAHARPDMPNEEDADRGKRPVHAYTPWHTAFCWLYGDLSLEYTIALLYFLNGVSLMILFGVLRKYQPEGGWERTAFLGVLALFLSWKTLDCWLWGNYGIVIAALSVLLFYCVEKKRDILCGFVWAAMMVKPQIATLFVFPILFQRRYKTIAVAVATCLLASLWPAYVYHESVVDLLLQVPRIGTPYETQSFFVTIVPDSFRVYARTIWMVFCFTACAFFCWLCRNDKPVWMKFVPVAFFFYIWTYGQAHDGIVAWNLVLFLALTFLAVERSAGGGLVRAFLVVACADVAFRSLFKSPMAESVINRAHLAGLRWVLTFSAQILMLVVYVRHRKSFSLCSSELKEIK